MAAGAAMAAGAVVAGAAVVTLTLTLTLTLGGGGRWGDSAAEADRGQKELGEPSGRALTPTRTLRP